MNETLSSLKHLTTDQPELLGWTLPGLEERTAIVTGAGSGIGAATARAMVAAGSRVLGVDRDEAGLTATDESIQSERFHTLKADLLNPEAPETIVAAAIDAFGGLTTIVNIAGVARPESIPAIRRSDLEFHMAINVYAPFLLTQAALPHLQNAHGQVVLCASSTSAYRGSPGAVAYTVSKHAVLGLLRGMTVELAPYGVRVNSISPGTTLSPINEFLFQRPGWADSATKGNPNGRIAEPHEHVGAIAYLISDLAKHVHGHDLVIDGGRLSH